ncbi:hypothetical protein [Pseudomonas sp. NUPR-001]|uniref:hypothetical protein n=1 Tax=Pseudomonas sp. NUPR-001 TaxID=3416058 RepID=UPI003F9558ED
MINSVLMAADALLCILVVLAALEYLRAVNFVDHPVLATSFYLVAIGAFGLLINLMRGAPADPWSVLMHTGVVMYAWARRQYIFEYDWQWNGQERRRRG